MIDPAVLCRSIRKTRHLLDMPLQDFQQLQKEPRPGRVCFAISDWSLGVSVMYVKWKNQWDVLSPAFQLCKIL